MPTVIGIFTNRPQAERAIADIRSAGVSEDKISIVAREGYIHGDNNDTNDSSVTRVKHLSMRDEKDIPENIAGERQNLSTGMTAGSALGGITGLLASAGLFTIPGLGPILALGPIAAGLTGVAAGGITGSLVDLGITPEKSKYYESEVEHGGILASVECDQSKINNVAMIFRQNGARDVETY